MANNMQKFPIADLQYGEATNAGLYTVCKAIHPNGYMAVQLPPCTLAFDAVDPNSRFAPKLKLKIGNSEQIAWLRAMDDKAKEALADKLEKYPFKATVNEGSYGCQIEVKPLGSIKVFVINAEGRKKRGTLADLKRGATVSVKATGFGIVLHKNNGGGSKICINAQKVWVLPEDTGDSEDEEECLFAPASKKQRTA